DEEATPKPEEQPSKATMRPKGDHVPHHRHHGTRRDSIQGVCCPREQRTKAEREPERRQQREATGRRHRCDEGTECTTLIKQMFHHRLLRCVPRFLCSCGLAPKRIADKPQTEDKDWQHHVIRIASEPPQPDCTQEHGEYGCGTTQYGNETANHARFE